MNWIFCCEDIETTAKPPDLVVLGDCPVLMEENDFVVVAGNTTKVFVGYGTVVHASSLFSNGLRRKVLCTLLCNLFINLSFFPKVKKMASKIFISYLCLLDSAIVNNQ